MNGPVGVLTEGPGQSVLPSGEASDYSCQVNIGTACVRSVVSHGVCLSADPSQLVFCFFVSYRTAILAAWNLCTPVPSPIHPRGASPSSSRRNSGTLIPLDVRNRRARSDPEVRYRAQAN